MLLFCDFSQEQEDEHRTFCQSDKALVQSATDCTFHKVFDMEFPILVK